jgi:hypothetical protein
MLRQAKIKNGSKKALTFAKKKPFQKTSDF